MFFPGIFTVIFCILMVWDWDYFIVLYLTQFLFGLFLVPLCVYLCAERKKLVSFFVTWLHLKYSKFLFHSK